MDDALERLAGTMPDVELARRLGVPVDAVKAWRRQHAVAPYLAEVVKVEPAHREACGAYVVVAVAHGTRREFIAVGADLVEACRAAAAALGARDDGPWEVEELRVVGEALR